MANYANKNRNRVRRPPKRRRPKGLIPIIKYLAARLGRKLMRSPLVPIVGGLVLLTLVLTGLVWAFTNKNALDVYVGDDVVATIAKSKDITDTWIYNNALAKLAADIGTNVQVGLTVTLTPVRSKKTMSVDYAIGAVYKAFSESPYKLEAAEVTVNGVSIMVLKNQAAVDEVFDAVWKSYPPVGVTLVEAGFIYDDVQIVNRFADVSEIETAERAIVKLTVKTEGESTYTVKAGDSVWQICRQHGITQEQLLELNPELVDPTRLKSGIDIRIITPKPIASVRTVEEITYTDVEKRPVEERQNNTKPKSYRNTIQTGKDGVREVLAHLVRINGVETERIEVSSTTLEAPVVEIVEVGTL